MIVASIETLEILLNATPTMSLTFNLFFLLAFFGAIFFSLGTKLSDAIF